MHTGQIIMLVRFCDFEAGAPVERWRSRMNSDEVDNLSSI